MRREHRLEFEQLLHHFALVGVGAFLLWAAIGAMSLAAGLVTIAWEAAIRFMAAVLVLMVPEVVYPDLKDLRYRSLSAEERMGFSADR